MAKMLLVVDFPSVIFQGSGQVSPQLVDQTEQFEATASDIAGTTSGLTQLSRNVWLLDAQSSWHFLLPILELAKSCRFPYSLLMIDGDVSHMNPSKPTAGNANALPLRV